MIFLNLGQDGSTNLFTADTLAEMRVYLQNWPAAAVAFDEAAEWTDEKYVAALEAWNKHVAKKEMTEEEKTAAVTLLQCIVAAATARTASSARPKRWPTCAPHSAPRRCW